MTRQELSDYLAANEAWGDAALLDRRLDDACDYYAEACEAGLTLSRALFALDLDTDAVDQDRARVDRKWQVALDIYTKPTLLVEGSCR